MRRVGTGSPQDRPPRSGRSKHWQRCQPPWITTRQPTVRPSTETRRRREQSFPGALSARNAGYGPGVTLCRPSAPQPPKPAGSTRPPRTYEILKLQSLLRRLLSRIGRTAIARLEGLRCGGSAPGLPLSLIHI